MTKTGSSDINRESSALDPQAMRRIADRRKRAAQRAQGRVSPATLFPTARFPEFDVFTDKELRLMIIDGNKKALEVFFQRHWKLVESIARKVHIILPLKLQRTVSLDDVKQIIVLDAIAKLKNKDHKLEHSAVSIAFGFAGHGALKQARHQANGVRIPEAVNDHITNLRNFLRGKKNDDVTLEMMAEHLQIPICPELNDDGEEKENRVVLVDVLRAMQFPNLDSLDAVVRVDEGDGYELSLDSIADLQSLTSDPPLEVDELCATSLGREAVWDALHDLKESWRDLLIENFGIANGNPKRLERIAEERGVSAQNVSAMKSRALTRLGEPNVYGENPLRDAFDLIADR